MANYVYKQENGEYVFYKDGELLKTPDDVVVKTKDEHLANLLETNLKHNVGYTSPFSFLTYHYTFSKLNAEYTQEFVAETLSIYADADALMEDEYLMFRQPSPIRPAVASFFEKELPECFRKYNLYQLSAILVINKTFNSWMLSHYIIADIIEPIYDNEDADFNALKEEFLDDLEEFECNELGDGYCFDDAYICYIPEDMMPPKMTLTKGMSKDEMLKYIKKWSSMRNDIYDNITCYHDIPVSEQDHYNEVIENRLLSILTKSIEENDESLLASEDFDPFGHLIPTMLANEIYEEYKKNK